MIEAVLEKAPNEPRFHSTRGHILVKLERYKEALPDLEEAKRVYTNDDLKPAPSPSPALSRTAWCVPSIPPSNCRNIPV